MAAMRKLPPGVAQKMNNSQDARCQSSSYPFLPPSLEQGPCRRPGATAHALVRDWVASIDLEPSSYGTHSMHRSEVAQIYCNTGNFRTVQLLLGHTKMDSTVRYLGVELEDVLAVSEAVEI